MEPPRSETILLTGGLGYIGSHIATQLLKSGHNVIIIDNCCNTSPFVLDIIERITGKRAIFYEMDLRHPKLEIVFRDHSITMVIHLAGLKSVTESLNNPLLYYDNNVSGTINLLMIMAEHRVKRLIFSSSASIYASSQAPLIETSPIESKLINPYSDTKYCIEKILQTLANSDPTWSIMVLRYFNPVGSQAPYLLGDNPPWKPNNLMPFMARVAYHHNVRPLNNDYECLYIFGDDYDTCDGTCVRDFIHVEDLARAHIHALNYLVSKMGYHVFNVGTGKGISVLELVNVFMQVNQVTVPYKIVERRPGDLPIVFCDNNRIKEELNWTPQHDLVSICIDAWTFQKTLFE
jgi:UDP-glucose 4-epimerase